MKYELLNITQSQETDVYDVINHEDGSVTETPTDRFCVAVYIEVKDNDTEFSHLEHVIVENHNDDSDDVINTKRQTAVDDFMHKINNSDFTPSENSQRMTLQQADPSFADGVKEVITENQISNQWAELKSEYPKETPSNNRVVQSILILSASAVLGYVIYWIFNH